MVRIACGIVLAVVVALVARWYYKSQEKKKSTGSLGRTSVGSGEEPTGRQWES